MQQNEVQEEQASEHVSQRNAKIPNEGCPIHQSSYGKSKYNYVDDVNDDLSCAGVDRKLSVRCGILHYTLKFNGRTKPIIRPSRRIMGLDRISIRRSTSFSRPNIGP